jgi:hypothetical protein
VEKWGGIFDFSLEDYFNKNISDYLIQKGIYDQQVPFWVTFCMLLFTKNNVHLGY